MRTAVTTEWNLRGAHEGKEFAQLTDTLSVGAFEVTTAEHKSIKGLRANQNLQDSMTIMELGVSSLTEAAAVTLHQDRDSQGFAALDRNAHEAGEVGGAARRDIEARLGDGKKVVSPINYKQLTQERQRQLQPPLYGEDEGVTTDE